MSAIISECGKYRYRLDREILTNLSTGPVYAFFGINPSTADASLDDATVRKWRGFVRQWGGSRFIIGNVFAYRATDVKELALVADPIGMENIPHIIEIAKEADIIVPCWGNRSKLPARLRPEVDEVLEILRQIGKPMKTFGLTGSGDPAHPLMLGYNTELKDLK